MLPFLPPYYCCLLLVPLLLQQIHLGYLLLFSYLKGLLIPQLSLGTPWYFSCGAVTAAGAAVVSAAIVVTPSALGREDGG